MSKPLGVVTARGRRREGRLAPEAHVSREGVATVGDRGGPVDPDPAAVDGQDPVDAPDAVGAPGTPIGDGQAEEVVDDRAFDAPLDLQGSANAEVAAHATAEVGGELQLSIERLLLDLEAPRVNPPYVVRVPGLTGAGRAAAGAEEERGRDQPGVGNAGRAGHGVGTLPGLVVV